MYRKIAACVCVCGACVYSFPLLTLISAFSLSPKFTPLVPSIFFSHPEIRSLNFPLITSVPRKGKKRRDRELMEKGRDLSCYDVRFQPGPDHTRKPSAGVIGYTHKHTHHEHDVSIALHATTAARGSGVLGRNQTRGGATKGILFQDHHAGQGKARHVDAR